MKAKQIIGNLLMAFLLVSVGVAIGKEMAAARAKPGTEPVVAPGEETVMVYYMHGIPCLTCTMIDTTAEALVRDEFAAKVEAGQMKYVSLNYLERENEPLADKYNVGSNMIIVARFRDGEEVKRVRLDKVMDLAMQHEQLADYIRQGIRACLEGGRE